MTNSFFPLDHTRIKNENGYASIITFIPIWVIFSPKKIHSNRLPAFPYIHRHAPNLPVLMSLHYLLDFKVKQRIYDY